MFDNCKAFLILLVVIGHFIEPCYGGNTFLYSLKWWIVSFHMPAFIFISGYFSKRELRFCELIRRFLVPYVVYECIYYLVYTLIGKETKLYLLYPKFSLWYLLALFAWRFATPYVRRIPCHMAFTIAAGLLIGCSDMKDNFLSLPRILVFYPFFLAGVHFTESSLQKLKSSIPKLQAAGAALGASVLVLLFSEYSNSTPRIFYGRYNYASLHQSIPEGMLCRLCCYLAGFVMTLALLLLMYGRRCFCSYIGTRTMAIYIFHGLVYSVLKECTPALENVDTGVETLILLAGCVCLTAVFSAPAFTAFTSRISRFHMPAALTHIKKPSDPSICTKRVL